MVPGSSPRASLLLTPRWRYSPPSSRLARPFPDSQRGGGTSFPSKPSSLSGPGGLAPVSTGEVPLCAWAGLQRVSSSRC